MVVLSCIAFSAACSGSTPGEVESHNDTRPTEVDLVISDPATAPEQLAMLIDFVSYRITCPDSGLTPYDDAVDIAGNFEATVDASPAVWTLVTNLPLSLCTISMWVFYEDEVICSGSQAIPILDAGNPSAPSKVNIDLVCTLSVIPPNGDLDIDGTFNLVHGNYCPQLFWLGAFQAPAGPTVMNVETSSFDLDNTCGQNCDPQVCDFGANPPTCAPGPDNGLTSTLFAPAGNGIFGDPNGSSTTYTCDPLFPGPTEICVLVSDGDNDCDQMRCLTIDCPDLCAGVVCDDGNECTSDRCDPLTGLCSNDPAPDGIACNNCDSTCQAGVCTGATFTADFNSSLMFIQGDLQPYTATLVNPYSGESAAVSGTFRVNNASYKGIGTADVLTGVNQNEVLLIKDSVYAQTICGVETLLGQGGFDVLLLADDFITLNDMVIDGGNTNDLIWANSGQDSVRGNNGDDRLDGGPGDDTIEGGNGNDMMTVWPGSGFDSISGGAGVDRVEIDAIQSQILITPAADPSYQFDISYLGTPMAQIREVELV
ncbi:MAG: hypothetical protein WBM46_07295, partial [Polyangiales bacterium]